MKKSIFLTLSVLTLSLSALNAAEDKLPPPKQNWRFDGMLGTFDKASAQRGFQVYKEVCSTCHSLNQLSYRHLRELGFTEAEVKAIASQYEVTDGPNEDGEMFQRKAVPNDRFKDPYPNEKAARAANNGAYPPDLSLITKSRPDGHNYLFAMLVGYKDAPKDVELRDGMYYNPYFPGKQIGMPPPLTNDQVTYADGTKATIEQMARDVVMFLAWAAEPEMESRKATGVKVLLFLLAWIGVLFATNRKIWASIKANKNERG